MLRKYVLFLVFWLMPISPASAVPIIGGATSLDLAPDFLDALAALEITIGLVGDAALNDSTAVFPITGGSLDTESGQAVIEHEGSGVSLSNENTVIELSNFIIDTGAVLLSGDVALNGEPLETNLPLFDVDSLLGLTLTAEAAGALEGAFNVPGLSGILIGTAGTAPQTEVPEPLSLLLLGAGLVVFVSRGKTQ